MPDNTTQQQPPRPFWLPDTQGFLASGLLLMLFILLIMLIYGPTESMKGEVLAVVTTIVGVLVGSLSGVYTYFFPGSKDVSGNNDALKQIALAPSPPPVAPAPVTPTQLGESMLANGELTYFRALTSEDAKKAFLAMSSAERQAQIAKG